MKMQLKKSKALSLALGTMLVATLSAPMAAFAAEPQGAVDGAAANGVVDVKAAPVAEVTKGGAVIGSYATLEEAIAAAKDGGTVKLLSSLNADQVSAGAKKFINITAAGTNVTIDLAGFTITMNDMDTIAVKAANVTLVVKNGTIINTHSDSYGLYTYTGADNANITFENLVLKTVDQAIGVQGNNSNQNVTLTGCTVTCDTTAVYWPPKSGLLTVVDTYIEAKSGITVKGGDVAIKGASTVKAHGPKVVPSEYYTGNPNKKLVSTGSAIYVESGYNDRNIALDVKEGTFESVNGVTVLYFEKEGESTEAKRDLAISGGTFIGEAPAPEFIVPGAGLQVDENGNLVAVDAKLVADETKVVNGVHSYDVKNGAIDEAYLLGLVALNVDPVKSGYEFGVDSANLAALNEAIAAKKAGATFDFVYTAKKADGSNPVTATVTVKLADSSAPAPGEGQGNGGADQGTTQSGGSNAGSNLPATGDASAQTAGAAAVAAVAAAMVAGFAFARREQN